MYIVYIVHVQIMESNNYNYIVITLYINNINNFCQNDRMGKQCPGNKMLYFNVNLNTMFCYHTLYYI